jgi:hypothetical protein
VKTTLTGSFVFAASGAISDSFGRPRVIVRGVFGDMSRPGSGFCAITSS